MVSIIPQPQHIRRKQGSIQLTAPIPINGNAGILKDTFPVGLFRLASPAEDALLVLEIDPDIKNQVGNEGYQLNIDPERISISAAEGAGLFYGVQTLRQLLPANPQGEIYLPCLEISDRPRFEWRGFLLDEARHFFGMRTVKQVLDWMSFFKVNRFHWHLTDYQGWRIEIEKYPRLTEIGSRRMSSQRRSFSKRYAYMDFTPHQGWYTKDDLREIVFYAAERNITIVPELDLPGHFSAALAAYPQLGCTKEQVEVPTEWGIFKDVACVGNPETREFLYNVLDEMADMFPGPYIHLGGDEVKSDHWESCPDCRQLKEEYRLDSFAQLNPWIMNELGDFLRQKGKTLIVWNEALHPMLDKSTVIMHWTPNPFTFGRTRRALLDGYRAILQPFWESYFDYAHSLVSLERVHQAKTLDRIQPSAMQNVIGVQGALWTEFVDNEDRLEWNTFPRMAAKAEVGWSQPGERSYNDFQLRWKKLQPHLEGIGLGNPAPLEACNPSFYRRNMALVHDVLRDMHAEQKRWDHKLAKKKTGANYENSI
jgi:hexosaminidase